MNLEMTMQDLPITIDQAAHWLNCTPAQVQALLAAGRLSGYSGRLATPAKPISLNSTVVLAESLPVTVGVFSVAEARDSDGGSRPRQPMAPRGRPVEVTRSNGPIVERRPLRPFVAR
jgi:hypothetical protein